jgi:hypothetical protein
MADKIRRELSAFARWHGIDGWAAWRWAACVARCVAWGLVLAGAALAVLAALLWALGRASGARIVALALLLALACRAIHRRR